MPSAFALIAVSQYKILYEGLFLHLNRNSINSLFAMSFICTLSKGYVVLIKYLRQYGILQINWTCREFYKTNGDFVHIKHKKETLTVNIVCFRKCLYLKTFKIHDQRQICFNVIYL